ncbi:MAG: beta-ketoacyl synthase N-terminal-like domain-containing protein [Caldilineaceae bacterium]
MTTEATNYQALLKDAVRKVQQMKVRLEAAENRPHEPLAVIGMACRFPGANTPAEFWALLRDGVDMMAEVPANRWPIDHYYDPTPGVRGKTYVREGAFLNDVDQFDPEFFNISPREAVSLDPQHRLLLEVSWEALEQAGIVPATLKDSLTGVFLAMDSQAYLPLLGGAEEQDVYAVTGNSHCFASGRLSYSLGLRGPNLVVNTACSASLVATHLACQSLRLGECDLALVGGVHLMLTPEPTLQMVQMKALAADGRCKTFDAAADGFNGGEGCGVIVLKRLADAVIANDPILAVIRGGAVNHDGISGGLTVPSTPAQKALLRAALQNSRVKPHEIMYVEAHGTGTALGDPIEAHALTDVFHDPHRPYPLWVGSVKTNIGHLEPAAGIAGLLKVILAFQYGEIPPHLHFHTPNPQIDWAQSPLRVPTERMPWPQGAADQKRLAGVSSFGMGGTNAHIILEEGQPTKGDPRRAADQLVSAEGGERPYQLLTLSAKNEAALRALVQKYGAFLDNPTLTKQALGDICYTAQVARTQFDHRLSVVADSVAQMRGKLADLADKATLGFHQSHSFIANNKSIAFMFTGQGAQYVNMGRELYETAPLFRAALMHCDALLSPQLGCSLLDLLYPDAGKTNEPALLDQTTYTQPVLFAFEYALATLWQSWGIEPDLLIGHSVGELVAACLAGVFSLEDALTLVVARGRLIGGLPEDGAMVAVLADEASVRQRIAPYPNDIAIAAVNGPTSVVISGKRDVVFALAEQLSAQGIKTRRLTVSHAFHSPLMEPILAEFGRVAESITYHPPQRRLISNVTGKLAGQEISTPAYWVQHIRAAVRFADGIATLQEQGCNVWLEIGPDTTLLGMAGQIVNHRWQAEGEQVEQRPAVAFYVPSLRKNQSDWEQILTSLGELYMRGVVVDWEAFNQGRHQRWLRPMNPLPTYPFQRQRYWLETANTKPSHQRLTPLLDRMLKSPLAKATIFTTMLGLQHQPMLHDYRIHGTPVAPGGYHLAMILNGAELLFERSACTLEDVIFPQPLVVPEGGTRQGQLHFAAATKHNAEAYTEFQLISFAEAGENAFLTHVIGKVLPQPLTRPQAIDLRAVQARRPTELAPDAIYQAAAKQQILYGASFRWLAGIWRGEGEVLGKLRQPESLSTLKGCNLHPGLLDACFQLVGAAQLTEEREAETYLLFRMKKLCVYQTVTGQEWWCYAKQIAQHIWDFYLLTDSGEVLAEIQGFEERLLPQGVAASRSSSVKQTLGNINLLQQLEQASVDERHSMLLQHLQTVMAKVLGVNRPEQIDVKRNLLDMGLDSLMAVEFRNYLQMSLSLSLPSTLIFTYPTLALLADYLVRERLRLDVTTPTTTNLPSSLNAVRQSTVVPIQPHGTKPPLFLAPGGTGDIFLFHTLAKYLDAEQPLYGLSTPGIDDGQTVYTEMASLVQHHIQSIKAIQPQGPYFLGGFSSGAEIAFAMVQALEKQGEVVAHLVIIDMNVPTPSQRQKIGAWDEARLLFSMAELYEALFEQKSGISLEVLTALDADHQRRYVTQGLLNIDPRALSEADMRRRVDAWIDIAKIYVNYRHEERCSAPITLFRASDLGVLDVLPDEEETQHDPYWGWNAYAAQPVTLYRIPGNHFTILKEPNVQMLAAQLQESLEAAMEMMYGNPK